MPLHIFWYKTAGSFFFLPSKLSANKLCSKSTGAAFQVPRSFTSMSLTDLQVGSKLPHGSSEIWCKSEGPGPQNADYTAHLYFKTSSSILVFSSILFVLEKWHFFPILLHPNLPSYVSKDTRFYNPGSQELNKAQYMLAQLFLRSLVVT